MATVIATRGASTFPVGGPAPGGILQAAWGTYNIATALSQNDIIHFCRVPKGATVIGGYVQAKDLDTGTEALSIDIGWAANKDEIADPDGFGDLGLWSGDAVLDVRPEVGIFYNLGGQLYAAGPKTFTDETIITGTIVTAANAGGTGNITVVVFYTMV